MCFQRCPGWTDGSMRRQPRAWIQRKAAHTLLYHVGAILFNLHKVHNNAEIRVMDY